jgi:hypothetical protein
VIDPIINPDPNPANQVANPVFDPAGGAFQDTLDVTISCPTSGATIGYTLDGSVPSETNGVIYTGPITLTQTTPVRAVAFHASLDPSDLVSVTYTKTNTAKSLTISSPTVACDLVQGQAGTINVTCMVTVTLCQVQSVTADVSQVGGAAAQPLVRFGNYWSWFGTVTPSTAGTRTITFTATDTTGAATTVAFTTVVNAAPAANAAPVIAGATAAGRLVRNQEGTVTVSCTATDSDGAVQSVRADLSSIGGPSTRSLALSGGVWTWSGPVTPTAAGTRTIAFIATDNLGASATTSAAIAVATNQSPVVTAPAATGTLVRTQAGTLSVSCQAGDPDGTVQSVRADLSAVGGSATQSLTFSSGAWTWSGTVTPTVAGTRTITFTAFDNQGASGSASTTIAVAAPNVAPSVTSPAATGTLVLNQSCAVSLSCTATDSDGTVQSVIADLSAIGGSSTRALSQSGNTWQWTGSVTPAAAGTRTITFTATDDDGAATPVSTTIVVTVPNQSPSVSDPQASGLLFQAAQGSVTVSCLASDPDGDLSAVRANLSAIGGSSTQSLTLSAGRWTWTGNVTPASSGLKTITFTATDSHSATASTTTTIDVAAPDTPPSVTNASATGDLVLSQSSSVTVTCDAADSDGTVQSVAANLAAIGGSSSQALDFVAGHWTWTGNVTPVSSGLKTITFTATDDQGATGSASATINVLGSQPGSLAGNWAGNVTYSETLMAGGGQNAVPPFERATTMVFSAGFQPESLAVYFGKSAPPLGPLVVSLPAAGLLNPGDQTTFTCVSGSLITITATVVQVSRSATTFSIDLDLQVVYSGQSSFYAGPYHWEGVLQSENQLSWNETTLLSIVGFAGIDVSIGSTGTLARQ